MQNLAYIFLNLHQSSRLQNAPTWAHIILLCLNKDWTFNLIDNNPIPPCSTLLIKVFRLIGSCSEHQMKWNNDLSNLLIISLGSSNTGAIYHSLLAAIMLATVAFPVNDKSLWELLLRTFLNFSKIGNQSSEYFPISSLPYPNATPSIFFCGTQDIPKCFSCLSRHPPNHIPHVFSKFNFAPDAFPKYLDKVKIIAIDCIKVHTKVVLSADWVLRTSPSWPSRPWRLTQRYHIADGYAWIHTSVDS